VFVNDALLLSGFRYDTPTGTFTSTPNAFLLDGIYFSSGGFGARFGNALSGVVSLRTLGRPVKNGGTLAVGLGNLAGSGALTLSRNSGIRATLSRFSTRPILWLNGSPRDYRPAPNGLDASVSGIWSYRPSGELKLFAISQSNRLGLVEELPDETGIYRTRTRNSVAILSWHDSFGRFSQTASLSLGARRQREEFGSFQIDIDTDVAQFFTYAGFEAAERVTLRTGGEWERLAARFLKSTWFSSHATDDRVAGFVEGDWRVTARLKVTPGFRVDRASLAEHASADPRLAAAWLLGREVTLTMAAGVYHQVREPLFFDSTLGSPRLKSMRAEQLVGGVQVGEGERILRLEVYGKHYRDLAQMTRGHSVVAGGGYRLAADQGRTGGPRYGMRTIK
jgi:vitamin B12 transporter